MYERSLLNRFIHDPLPSVCRTQKYRQRGPKCLVGYIKVTFMINRRTEYMNKNVLAKLSRIYRPEWTC